MAPNGDTLSALDAAFLQLEDGSAHMHVGAVLVFDGPAPSYDEMTDAIARRLHRVPRFRQRVAWPPGKVARPRWVDDPRFDVRFHVHHAGLPGPGTDDQLRTLAAQLFGEPLDKDRPLWELWLVDGLAGDRFAIVNKTHHALVDGIAGMELAALILDLERKPADEGPPPRWEAPPPPSPMELFAHGVGEQVRGAAGVARGLMEVLRDGEQAAASLGRALRGAAEIAGTGLSGSPRSSYNVPICSGRRYAWVERPLDEVRAARRVLGGTLNDLVLAAVSGGLRTHLLRRGEDPAGLRAMVPVSVRAPAEQSDLGNRISSLYGTLPVEEPDALDRLAAVRRVMNDLKHSAQSEGGEAIMAAGDLAPPPLLGLGVKQLASPRLFHLTVTNIPGPQVPLYLLGRELTGLHPIVPLAPEHALGIAIMSYNGRLSFGLLGCERGMADLDHLAADIDDALVELIDAAGWPSLDREGVTLLRR